MMLLLISLLLVFQEALLVLKVQLAPRVILEQLDLKEIQVHKDLLVQQQDLVLQLLQLLILLEHLL
nr:MAG TPA: hypothetical protein [Bacteriophage sp.]